MTETFEAPGPGSWEHDADHQAAPRGRLAIDMMTDGFTEGFQSFFGRYGMPLDRFEASHVHGWMYMHAVPAGVPDKGGSPPPNWVLSILTRLIPELRRRNKTAAAAQADKLWLADAEGWLADRDEWLSRFRALAAVEPAGLSPEELAAHTSAVTLLAADISYRHFALLGPAIGIGELLVAAAGWGLDPQEVAALLAGSSPASNATKEPLVALCREIDKGDSKPTTLAEVRAVSDAAAAIVDGFLSEYGWRALSDDVADPTLAENPEVLLGLIAAVRHAPSAVDIAAAQGEIRAAVPAPERDRFDEMLADARACYEVLDDNSGLFAWAGGLVRRTALEVGSRLVVAGEAEEVTDTFLMSPEELVSAAAGGPAPGDLDARRQEFARSAELDPPAFLGDEPSGPPDMSVFPGPLARMGAAMNAYLDLKFTVESGNMAGRLAIDGLTVATGEAVGQGSVVGRIVVCEDAMTAMDRLEPGDILVCPVTTPAWNALFPLLGGIVTKFGGPLGHSAVMAREFGIPAIVGIREASSDWDGATGKVTLGD